MYFEYYFLGIILIPAIILAIYAQLKVQSNYNKYIKIKTEKNLTANEVASLILNAADINDVTLEQVSGELTDHYDSKKLKIGISEKNFNSTSVASIGIVAHECGHAIQHASNYFPLKLRHLVISVYNLASKLLMPIILIGLVFDFLLLINGIAKIFLIAGIVVFGISLILNLVTLPVEFNASRRALKILKESEILNQEELKMAKKVLSSAALTYVAAFLYSLLNFLRFVLIFARHRDN